VGDIIQHIRNLVTTDTPDLYPAPLHAIINQAIQVVESETGNSSYELRVRAAVDLPRVLADELQIQLVLVNLLRNALRVVEGLANKDDRIIHIRAGRSGDREVEVAVVDRGPGIPPDRVLDMFEPFASEEGGGMGMGLAICRLIVEAHGGRIWYEPNPAGGAIMSFTLRVVEDTQA
jgi:signal transduction histidine kinase